MTKILIIERAIFYLTLLFLPTQLGRHFWPEFSTVLGMRIDYLSPTIYFTDVLIFLLFASFVFRKIMLPKVNFEFKIFRQRRISLWLTNLKLEFFAQRVQKEWWILPYLALLVIGIINAKNPLAGWYGLLKFFEFFFFGLYVSWQKISFSKIAFVFSFAIIFEGSLTILQYFAQGSLGEVFYFFGERTFNSQTPGIANASLDGTLILRPYGTLPHPNVLGGYLTIAMAMVISIFHFPFSIFKKIIYGIALVVGTGALLLSMSRVAILLWLAVLGFYSLKRSFFFLLPVLIIFAASFFFPSGTRLLNASIADESVAERVALMKSSLLMIKDSPLVGVGINNFLVNLPGYQEKPADIFTLQPVHNIYLLMAAETGILGLFFFLWFLTKTFQRIRKKKSMIRNSLFIILVAILTLGFFDHYFFTLQQGQMLFAFVLGLCWAKKLND